jgi:para-nitrobenzyl esterase
MKFIATIFLAILSVVSVAQCDDNRYRNFLFTDVSVTSDIVYGSNEDLNGLNQELLLDIYEPTGDSLTNRPLVIMCHGGFFLSGDKAAPDVLSLCEDLARMGYVVASINYRMGVPLQLDVDNTFSQAVMRAVQDLNAAIRWFRRDVDVNGNTFGIDPENIYTFGTSAGGFMVLQQAYMDDDEIPSFLDTSAPGLTGGVEGDSGSPGYSSAIKGLVSHCGAMGDNAWIDADEQTPACLFHGSADNTVPIDSTMFTLLGFFPVAITEGSIPISERMTGLGIEHCFEINEDAGHVAYLTNQAIYDTTLSISSNFLSHLVCGIELDCSYREVLVGVNETHSETIAAYPNPAQDFIYLVNSGQAVLYAVYDSQGRCVAKGKDTRISTETWIEGLYVIRTAVDAQNSSSTTILVSHP